MANIDQLNFEVILHDKDFNDKIKADLNEAKKFNTQLSKILEIQNKLGTKQLVSSKGVDNARELNQILAEIKEKYDGMKGTLKVVEDSTEKGTDKEKQRGDAVRRTNSALSGSVNLMHTLAQLTGITFGVAGIRRFVSSMVEVTGNLEMQREAMNHILGSAEKGGVIFEQLKELAKPSYFNLPDLTKYAKQLSALSIPYEELFETTKMLGDVSAGLGVSFDRIALAYGHIRSMGFLRGMQARQLTNAGIPIFEELAKNLSEVEGKLVSISDVYDRMSKRQITFEQVKEVFVQMTSEGGKFYDMQIAMTDTLAGRINKLKGVWQIALSDLGNANSGVLKGTVNTAIKLVEHLDKIGSVLSGLIAAFGTYGAALAVAATAQKALAAAELITRILKMTEATNALSKALKWVSVNGKAAAAGLGILAAAGVVIYEVVQKQKEANALLREGQHTIEGYMTSLNSEKKALKSLTDQLQEAKRGTQEYNEAKDEILRKYDQYLSKVDRENLAIGKTAGLYDALALSIEKASRATFLANMDDWTQKRMKAAGETAMASLKRLQFLTDSDRQLALGYIFGQIPKENLPESVQQLFAWKEYSGTVGAYNIINFLGQIKTAYEDSIQAIIDDNKRVRDALRGDAGPEKPLSFDEALKLGSRNLVISDDEITESKKRVLDWQKDIIKAVEEAQKGKGEDAQKNIARLLGYGTEQDWDNYRTAIKKKRDELADKLAGEYRPAQIAELRAEISLIDEINRKYFNGALLANSKSLKKEDSAPEKERKQRIADAKAEIANLRKYMEVYESFVALVGKEAAKVIFGELPTFKGLGITDFDFAKQIKGQLKVLDGLGDDAKQAADGIRASLGLGEGRDLQKQLTQAQRTANAYRELIRSWSAEDTDIEGKGFWHDISKVASDLETKLNKLAVQGQKAKEGLAGIDTTDENQKAAVLKSLTDSGLTEKETQDFWDTWVAGGEAAIDRIVRNGSDKAKAKAAESARDLARTFVQDFYTDNNIDLTSISNKSLTQIRSLKKELNGLLDIANGRVSFDIPAQTALAGKGIAIFGDNKGVDLEAAFKELEAAGTPLTEAQQGFLKLRQAVGKAGGSFDDFAGVVKSLADKGLKNLSDEEKKLLLDLGRFAVDNISQVADAVIGLAEATGDEGLAGAISDIQDIGEVADSVIQGFQQGGWIGAAIAGVTSVATKMLEAETAAAQLRRAIAKAREEFRVSNFENALSEGVETLFGENTWKKVQNGLGKLEEARAAIENQGKDRVVTKHRTNLWENIRGKSNEYRTLTEAAKEFGTDLYDKYGNLNVELLQAILDTYDGLSEKDRDWLTAAIHNSEMYAKALEQLDSVIEDVFGNIVDSAADKIVDSWWEAGEAALDYADILDDVAKSYAKLLVKQILFDTAFDEKATERLREAFADGDSTKAMEIVAEAMEKAESMLPVAEKTLEAFEPYVNRTDSDSDSDSDTVSSGIKSITEDTANLLASYLNGMRADLSVIRSIQVPGWQNVAQIKEMLQQRSAPSYNEYMAQIAADTANMARGQAEILSKLKSIITTSGNGGSAVRTTK